MRRKSKVAYHVPSTYDIKQYFRRSFSFFILVYVDKNTPRPFVEDLSVYGYKDDEIDQSTLMEDHIYLDAMGLGMGCCCLQVTFQAQSIDEARFLYDQLTPLTPIMVY